MLTYAFGRDEGRASLVAQMHTIGSLWGTAVKPVGGAGPPALLQLIGSPVSRSHCAVWIDCVGAL